MPTTINGTSSFRSRWLLAVTASLLVWVDKVQAVGDFAVDDNLLTTGVVVYSPFLTTGAIFAPFTLTTGAIDSQYKILLQAQSDAALFVATAGHHRGAYLTAALQLLREQGAQESDQVLAEGILAWQPKDRYQP